MSGAPKPFVEPWLRRVLRALVLAVCTLVAANFCARWWYWEVRAPALHLQLEFVDRLGGRLALLYAVATLAAGLALYDLVGSLPRVGRRALACLAAAAVLAATAFLVGLWMARH